MSERLSSLRTEIAALEGEHRLREIVPLLREAVEVTREEAGADSRPYVAILNELGSLLRTLKDLDPSEASFSEAAGIESRARGRTADYATCINNLAGTLRLKGEFARAEGLFRESLEIYEADLGVEHFVYLSALNNLGLVYQDLKRYEEAEALHRQALCVLQARDQHDTTYATTLNNLASVAMATGRFDDAKAFLAETLQVYRGAGGTGSVLYITALNNLAVACFMAEDFKGAEARYQEALERMDSVLGPEHPDTLRAKRNLARTREKLS